MIQIETIHLFPGLTAELLNLLKSLKQSEWDLISPIPDRSVKDLVAHLIDGSLRRLALQRDNYEDISQKTDIRSYNDLIDHIQKLNKDWIIVARRLSPAILIDLLEYSETSFYEYFASIEANDKAFFPVAWAGEDESKNWFDIAREYTEKWHHQMQIRMAIGAPLLMEKRYIEPLYNTFMLALPHLYNNMIEYPEGETIKVSIRGILNKSWTVVLHKNKWSFIENKEREAGTTIELKQSEWDLISPIPDREKDKYFDKIRVSGRNELGLRILELVTVMS